MEHGGAIDGWYTELKVMPDAKVGVFISTTNSVDDADLYTNLFSNWLVDYVLGT